MVAWASLLVAAGLAASWLYGLPHLPLESDAQGQFFLAERAASGVPPHLSAFNAKNGLAFLVSGGAIRLGRLLGASDLSAARAATALALALSVAAVGWLAYRLSGSRLAAGLSALCLVSFNGLALKSAMGAEPKVFLLLFLLLALLARAEGRPFWTGLASCLAFLCWQPAGLLLAAAVAAEVWQPAPGTPRRPGRRRLLLLALGAALPLVAYEAYFAYHGALGRQLYQAYVFPARFMIGAAEGMSENRGGLLAAWRRGFHLGHPAPAFFVALLAARWWPVRTRPSRRPAPPRAFDAERAKSPAPLRAPRIPRLVSGPPGWLFFFLAADGAVLFTLFDHQGYPDLFFLLPFMAVATGAGAAALSAGLARRGRRVVGAGLVGALAAVLLAFAIAGPRRFHHRYTLAEQLALAAEVGRLAEAADGLYAVGCAHLLAFNHLDNWSPYADLFRGVRQYLLARSGGRFELPARDGRLPAVVLSTRRLPGELEGNLRRDYAEATPARYQRQGISVWVRNDRLAGLAPLLAERRQAAPADRLGL
jgi:hypothetical protein